MGDAKTGAGVSTPRPRRRKADVARTIVPRLPVSVPLPDEYPLRTPTGEPVTVVHLAAELAPFARTGGLGEAVSSLAHYQSLSGLSSIILMPLYRQVRDVATDLEPVGDAFEVVVGPRHEQAVTTVDDGFGDCGDLVGQLARTVDDLGKPLAHGAMVVDPCKIEVFEWIGLQPLKGAARSLFRVQPAVAHGVEQRAESIHCLTQSRARP